MNYIVNMRINFRRRWPPMRLLLSFPCQAGLGLRALHHLVWAVPSHPPRN